MKINDKALAAYACTRSGIDKEGYLDKKGDLNHSYKRRWFVLKGNLLFYFEKSGERQPIGMIVLENCSVEVSDCDRYSFCVRYQAISSASRTYTLCAENDVEMEKWMKSITSASFGYIDMLVNEFEKTLRRLKTLDSVSKADGEGGTPMENSHSGALLSKAKDLLDIEPLIDFSDSTDSSVPIRPARKKHSNTSLATGGGNGGAGSSLKDIVQSVKIKPALDIYTINTLNRFKAKSVGSMQRSRSSENIAKDTRSPSAGRKSMKNGPLKDRTLGTLRTTTTGVVDPEEYDKSTFDLLHTCFGAAIWTKIGETL